MKDKLRYRVNAKINIGLNILCKRSDGYHEVETLMHPISLYDELEFTPSKEMNILSDVSIGCLQKDNIINKCINEIAKKTNTDRFLNVVLHKNIPMQAGMGGGSADGACAMIAYNEIYSLGLSIQELCEIAGKIGVDIAFFLSDTAALCTGIGEKIKGIKPVEDVCCLIIKPDIGVDTKKAYSFVDEYSDSLQTDYVYLMSLLYDYPHRQMSDIIHNEFEAYVFSLLPKLSELKDLLYSYGAFAAGLTGSGSAFYALFDDEKRKEKAALALFGKYGTIFSTSLCSKAITRF